MLLSSIIKTTSWLWAAFATDPACNRRQRIGLTPAVRRVAVVLFAVLLASGLVRAVPLEVYGRLPDLEDVAISPDGTRIALVQTMANQRILKFYSLTDRKVLGALRVGEMKLRHIEWADDHRLLIHSSDSLMPWGLRGREREWSLLQVYDVETRITVAVPDLRRFRDDSVMNAITGDVMVRRIGGHTVLFVPGFKLFRKNVPALFRVDLDTGRQEILRIGSPATERWLVDAAGEIVAVYEYNDEDGRWSLAISRNGVLGRVATGNDPIDRPQLVGFGPTADTLQLQSVKGDAVFTRLISLSDGTNSLPPADMLTFTSSLDDRSRLRMVGGVVADEKGPHHRFFDPALQSRWDTAVEQFEGSRLHLVSAADNFKVVVVKVDGPSHGYRFDVVELETGRVTPIGALYAGVTEPLESRAITYRAADQFNIPAFLTLPRGREARKLPLIVLPHGGPAAKVTADFDWMSQALADQGYAVLRPNFRGSTVNQRFVSAGFGEWGRKMQTDLSDGVRHLVGEGIADPARVCIVGASYGGYAALAGVTIESGIYRCAVSIAGISDLRRMLVWVNDGHGSRDNSAQRYWDRFMGVTGPDDALTPTLSPIKHLATVTAPVLLIHGRDDTVVPFEQSDDMFYAMLRARKKVELVKLDNEDHWLSRSETRLQTLKAMVAFLRANNPPD
jgi:dipeptidyl aminopeptidase/acylaminoacyl peptidase